MKLALGTVQFGLDYGVANAAGRTPPAAVREILDLAAASGIEYLDTARAYGDAETVLGELLGAGHGEPAANHRPRFRLVTKPAPGVTAATLRESLTQSARALRGHPIDTLLFHRAADLEGEAGAATWHVALQLRQQGHFRRLGLSAYTGAELRAAMARFPLEVVQVPVNLFDQRLLADGTLDRLHDAGIEVHVRSAFLQGLLLMEPAQLPAHLALLRAPLARFDERCHAAGITRLSACLGFLNALPAVGRIVVGVNDAAQLRAILLALRPDAGIRTDDLAIDDPELVDPSRWGRAA